MSRVGLGNLLKKFLDRNEFTRRIDVLTRGSVHIFNLLKEEKDICESRRAGRGRVLDH